jgi:hypothetical protein
MKKLIIKDNTILKLREQLGQAKRMEDTEKTGLRERCHKLEKENRELNKMLKDRCMLHLPLQRSPLKETSNGSIENV